MRLQIKYSNSSIQALINNQEYFKGRIKKKFWKSKWILFSEHKEQIASYAIKSKYFHFNFSVILSIEESGQKLQLEYISKKPHINSQDQSDNYLIIFHVGNKISFFKNDTQFASLSKQSVSFGRSKTFDGLISNQVNLTLALLLIFATIILDDINNFEEDSDFNIDLGSYHKELRPFDSSWDASSK